MGPKPLRAWFEKIDRFIKIYDGIRYLVLFASERYNATYNRIKYVMIKKNGSELIHIILYLQKKY